jgi:hypothetical protein
MHACAGHLPLFHLPYRCTCTGTSLHLAHTGVHIHTGVHNHACGHRFIGTSLHLTHTGVHTYVYVCMYVLLNKCVMCSFTADIPADILHPHPCPHPCVSHL